MKCPHCEYEDSIWSHNTESFNDGNRGGFFELRVQAERSVRWNYSDERRAVYGCPSCGVMFMDV